jgi:ribosomal protein S11
VRVPKAITLLAGVPVVLSLSGCLGVETTPEKSARAAAKAKTAVTSQKGLDIGAANAQVKVEDSALVQDPNGVAAVVRLKNTGPTQVTLPIAITVADAKGQKLYANDTPGLDPSLTSLPVLKGGEEVDWVNNQILVAGKAAKVAAQVGRAKGKSASGALPKIAIDGVTHGKDEDGFFAQGTLKNESGVSQKRLVVTCVARDGDRVIAAGRAVVEKLDPFATTKKPTKFTVFFIGDPGSAKLGCSAPPTVLS